MSDCLRHSTGLESVGLPRDTPKSLPWRALVALFALLQLLGSQRGSGFLLCLQDREGVSPLPQECCNSQVYWGWSCDTQQVNAGHVVFKTNPSELGWVGLQAQVPSTALQPLGIKMGLSLEHRSCSGAAKAPSRLLRELCPWPWGAGDGLHRRGQGWRSLPPGDFPGG